jgi:hypothetical protein
MTTSSMRRPGLARWPVAIALWTALAIAPALGGCALSPDRPEVTAQSQALALRQHQQAEQAARQVPGRRLWFAGLAMNSTSKAFQGDLELVDQRLATLGHPVLRYEFSNEPQTSALRYPFAAPRPLAEALRRIGAQARADDIVVLLISTHGNSKVLSVNAAGHEYAAMRADELAAALAPLGDTPTVVLLSACYSGSFIPELARDNRIVLTAASADRSSYGCNFQSRNTFFIEEFFNHNFDASKSLAQLATQAQAQIAQREQAAKLRPSQPQVAIGSRVAWLANLPMKDWLATPTRMGQNTRVSP